MEYLYKTFINGICCEIGIAKKPKATIIFCPGLPEFPKKQNILKKLTSEGFNTIYPRYRGTFESEGYFLEKSSAYDIEEIISQLKKDKEFKEIYNNENIKISFGNNIIIVGNSFGGSVAIHALSLIKNSNGLIFCPVTNFKELGKIEGEQNLVSKKNFFMEGFKFIYRYSKNSFNNLIGNRLIPPSEDLLKNFNGKIILYHGKDDKTVNPQRSKNLSKQFNFITLKIVKGKHINLDDIPFDNLKEDLEKLSAL